jgi:hypothetical protein
MSRPDGDDGTMPTMFTSYTRFIRLLPQLRKSGPVSSTSLGMAHGRSPDTVRSIVVAIWTVPRAYGRIFLNCAENVVPFHDFAD